MTGNPDGTAREAARQFSDCPLLDIARLGGGNINDTYLARFDGGTEETRIVVQKINGSVFRSPRSIVANMIAVGPHLDRPAARGEETFAYPRLLPDRSGNMLWTDADGACWRATAFVNGSTTFPVVRDAVHAGEVGRVIGRFHRLTAGLDVGLLHDTLPGFHNCPQYLAGYDATVAPGGGGVAPGRAKSEGVPGMMSFVEKRRDRAAGLEEAVAAGRCRRRVMHGDPKADNVLIASRSGRGVGLLDFDTVKPGLWHYDFGDAARSACNPVGEDAPACGVFFDMARFVGLASTYLEQTGDMMPDSERALLGKAVWLLTFELGVRFLADYLACDVYFKVADSDRNRRRALVQFRLCADIEGRQAEIEDTIGNAGSKR
jgi:hypothetical protein